MLCTIAPDRANTWTCKRTSTRQSSPSVLCGPFPQKPSYPSYSEVPFKNPNHTHWRKAILHPGLDGGLECRVVDMTADLAPAGPSAEEKAAGRRRGPKRAAGFFHGGAEDKAFLENMVERAAIGGPDKRLWWLPITPWQMAKVTLFTIQ